MESPNLNTLMEPPPLQEPDLAQANGDLASWLLQDDDAQLGFCQGAKEMHSSIPGENGHASPPFLTSAGDVPDLDIYGIDWSQPLSMGSFFTDDPKSFVDDIKSLENDQDLTAASNETSASLEPSIEAAPDNDQQEQIGNTTNEVVDDALLHWNGSIPTFVAPDESLASAEIKVGIPQVISVPISDAVVQQEAQTPLFRTVSIASTQPKPAPVMVFKTVQSSGLLQPKEPQKVVINLRRVSINQKIPSAVTPSYPVVSSLAPPRTLKEVMSSNNADDELKDLLSIPQPEHSPPSIRIDHSQDNTMEAYDIEGEPIEYEEISIVSPKAESIDADMSYEELTSDDGIYFLSPSSSLHSMVSSPSSSSECSYPASPSYKSPKTTGRKTRASSFSPLEKKLRKKEQNKRAALRYRLKKKEEEDSVMSKLQREEERQKLLTEKFNMLQMEVNLLKKLQKEVEARKKAR